MEWPGDFNTMVGTDGYRRRRPASSVTSSAPDFGACERLLVAAQEIDHRSYVIALLGGAAS